MIVFALVFVGVLPGLRPSKPKAATLEFWGIQDDEEVWNGIIAAFREQYPHIMVNYRRFDDLSYEDALVNNLAAGTGPDVFVLKNSWIVKHRDKIYPLPQIVFKFTDRDFQRTFVDVASADLISSEKYILGLPLFVDTLALFYNKDIFNTEGVAQPPQEWNEVVSVSQKLTKKAAAGDIAKSGMALGGAKNIENLMEILSALILQRGDPIIDSRSEEVKLESGGFGAFEFYTSFADPTKPSFFWSERLPNSLDALAEGKAAMALGFARDVSRMAAKNPHLDLGIAPLPQLKDSQRPITFGSYFALTVSRLSKNPNEAWQFIVFATLGESTKKYLEETNRPAARRDLVAAGSPTTELDVFYKQSLQAKSWPVPDERAARRIFQDAVESIVTKSMDTDQAVSRLGEQLSQLQP